MKEFLAADILRMLERILVAGGGILAIYLGYRLFQIAQLRNDGKGKFKSALFEFSLSRVGPGVFFALFGAYVLYTSLDRPISFSPQSNFMAPFLNLTQGEPSISGEELRKLQTFLQKLPEEDRVEANKLIAGIRQRQFRPPIFIGEGPRLDPG